MRYALFADLHSSVADTAAVLADIRRIAPDAHLFCLGDVHECHVGKKRAKRYSFESLSLVVTLDDDFIELIDFKTLLGRVIKKSASCLSFHHICLLSSMHYAIALENNGSRGRY